MIPESAGATPYGIFLLADSYLKAARIVMAAPGNRTAAPPRLLAYHAAELFLKTYMRSAGETIATLRGQGHDLLEMVERSQSLGLKVPKKVVAHARRTAAANDYVRARYVVTELSEIPLESVLEFAEKIRALVIAALDFKENGVPRSRHWLGELPSDYPRAIRP